MTECDMSVRLEKCSKWRRNLSVSAGSCRVTEDHNREDRHDRRGSSHLGDQEMNASKEEARRALENLRGHAGFDNSKALEFVEEFLKVAERKLPTEAAFARDRKTRLSRGTETPE